MLCTCLETHILGLGLCKKDLVYYFINAANFKLYISELYARVIEIFDFLTSILSGILSSCFGPLILIDEKVCTFKIDVLYTLFYIYFTSLKF